MIVFVGKTALKIASQCEEAYAIGDVRVTQHARELPLLLASNGEGEGQVVFCHPPADAATVETINAVLRESPVPLRLAQVGGDDLALVRHQVQKFAPDDLAGLAAFMRWPRRTTTLWVGMFSLKGGSGKTMTTLNLAAMLAQGGVRVLIVDGDLTNGNLRILTQIPPTGGLAYLATVPLNADTLRDAVQTWEGVHVLHAEQAMETERLWSESRAEEILAATSGLYDVVIVDLPADVHFTPFSAALLRMAERNPTRFLPVVVAAFGVSEMDGADAVLNMLKRHAPEESGRGAFLVVNRVVDTPAVRPLFKVVESLQTAYELPKERVVYIPDIGDVALEAGLLGKPVHTLVYGETMLEQIRYREKNTRVASYQDAMKRLADGVMRRYTAHAPMKEATP